jgi:hypothetical protein
LATTTEKRKSLKEDTNNNRTIEEVGSPKKEIRQKKRAKTIKK